MYPLNMTLPAGGFAVANDEHEHAALTERGYVPPLVAEHAPELVQAVPQEAEPAPVKRGPGRPRKAE